METNSPARVPAGEGLAQAPAEHGSDADRSMAILRERALKLARKSTEEDRGEQTVELIEFVLGQERYALEVRYVREVYPLKDMTPIPCTPSFVLGMINVRGNVVSVMDVKEFFDLPRGELTDMSRVLILKNQFMEVGVLADQVLGERKIPVSEVNTGSAAVGRIRDNYVKGITRERLIVLDGENLLSDKGIVVHQEIAD